MMLNEYIYEKMVALGCVTTYSVATRKVTKEDIEYWIVEWYKDKYGNIPPLWLADRENDVRI